ncbi:HAMP domain-containing protein, partial [Streptomyces sp. I8-5]|uniref:HAMP domain-containing protein n=1 Tax=Streptomyces sp. I8-5 TaxID=3104277 RepID=UPI00386530A3
MTGALRRLRALPLRSRLALLVATAVAIAVAAVAAACWFVTKVQLENQMDASLRSAQVDERYLSSLYAYCRGTTQLPPRPYSNLTVQLIDAQGTVCIAPKAAELPVSTADVAVVGHERAESLHWATAADGVRMRVYTTPLRVSQGLGQPPMDLALTLARPVSEVDRPLSTLAWVLLVVSGIGVVGAGAAGLWVARTGLRPVDELTEAVEHVARTEDLTVRIPVDGEDEIARLSRSFNSMTESLASSRDRQAQLIADAGHELRTPLTSLRTNVELLARSDDTGRAIPPDDRKALMKSVKAQMTELASLIGDLQELARPD